MELIRIYPTKDNNAILECPHCRFSKRTDISKYMVTEKAIKGKLKCKCGHSYQFIIERRVYFRKNANLRGIFVVTSDPQFALYWMKVKPEYNNFEIGYEISNLDVMLRIHPNKKHVLPSVNQALRQMIDTGLIARIHAKYR